MRRVRILLSIFTLTLAIAWLLPVGMRAQDTNRAALVVRHSETSVETECVEFTEDEITGLELLQRSGLDFGVDVQGLGALVCRIDQTGCSTEDCWCQCKGGGDCVYWSYWHQVSKEWQYSQAGAAVYSVRDGDVEGWSWGPGAANVAFPPPDSSFDSICGEAAGNVGDATPTSSPTPIIFVPQNTPENQSTVLQPGQTATTAPTATERANDPTIAAPSPIPTNTLMPTPTAVAMEEMPVAGGTSVALTAPESPTQIPNLAIVETPVQLEPEVTLAVEAVEAQSEPPIIAEMPEVAPSAIAQVPDSSALAASEAPSEPTSRLTVVGSGVRAEHLQVQQPAANGQTMPSEKVDVSSSPYAYVAFGLIMLALLVLSAVVHARRKERLGVRTEPQSRA